MMPRLHINVRARTLLYFSLSFFLLRKNNCFAPLMAFRLNILNFGALYFTPPNDAAGSHSLSIPFIARAMCL